MCTETPMFNMSRSSFLFTVAESCRTGSHFESGLILCRAFVFLIFVFPVCLVGKISLYFLLQKHNRKWVILSKALFALDNHRVWKIALEVPFILNNLPKLCKEVGGHNTCLALGYTTGWTCLLFQPDKRTLSRADTTVFWLVQDLGGNCNLGR